MADITKIDTFIQSSPHPAWLATDQGHCVYANPALERLTGCCSNQINQADWRTFLLEEDRAVASASWQTSLATGTPYRGQVRMRGSDGVPKCVELIAFGHKAADGPELWLFTGLEVNHVAAQKPPQLEAQLRATLNVIPAYTWYALPYGALTFVNERTANYLGLPKDHPLRFGIDTSAEWDSHTALLHPDDREEARRVWSTCLSTGSAGEFTFRVPSAEGRYRWFLTRAEPLRASDGTLLYWIGINLDIDDAKRAEEALRKSEKEIRELVDTIPGLIHTARPDGYIDYFNKRWLEYFGLTLDEVAGWNWTAVIHAEDVEGILTRWRACLVTGEVFEYETRVRGADGEYRWMLHRKVPLRDANGNIVKWYGSSMDIHERKTAEEALRSSQAYLAEAQRLSQTGSFGWRPESGEIVWSDETYRIFGYDHAVRPTIDSVVQRIHPEDRPDFSKVIESASAGATGFEHTYRLLLPDGSVKHVHALAHALQDASGNREYVGAATDVTSIKRAEEELRKSEKELRDVIDTIPAAVWSALPDGSNTYANKRWVEYLGLSAEQTAGSGWQAAIHPDDLERHAGKWMRAVSTGKPHENESRYRRSDGQYRWHLDRGVPLRDEDGNIVKWYGVATDIEDRKRAEEAQEVLSRDLQASKAKLEEAQRITHVGYWEWDILTGRVNWSDETYRIYGMQPQERPMDIAACQEKIYPEDWQRGMEEALVGRARFDAECRVIRPTGEVRICHFQGEVRRDASSRPYQMFGTVQDITDRKRAEEELLRSQFYLSEGQRLGQAGSWALNPSGCFEYWSQELFRIYGLDPQTEAPTLEQYLATVHPQDRDFMADTVKRMCAQGSGCDVKKRIIRPDGAVRYVRCVGIPVLDNGVLKRFLGTAMDVTEQEQLTQELQRREAYLAEAQRLSRTGSWAWSPDTDVRYWSEECYRVLGFDPRDGLPRMEEFIRRIHPDDQPAFRESAKRAGHNKLDEEVNYRIVHPDGRIRDIHSIGHPVFSPSGDLIEYTGTVIDITESNRADEERRAAEQEREKLHQLEADLAHINRVSTLGELAASLAHEIKQPIAAAITSANSCIEWLAHDPPNLDRARAAAARIDKYGNRAAEIIDRIRSFYKKSPPKRELIDVNGIIHEMLTLLEGEATRSSIAMRTDLSSKLPKIMVDRVQLQQVFMNLMLNAIEAMMNSGGELTVKSHLQEGQLQFSVSDTGVGLPADKMDQIFSAFFTTKPQGSGMGLAISRSIVESHGGRLWASANSEAGATFHFTLPIHVTESSPLVA
jgi:PAS domain S-box-containing protein